MELLCSNKGRLKFKRKLILHISKNKNKLLKSILNDSPVVCNVVDDKGSTLLHYSVEYRNSTISKYLIKRGTNIDVQNKKGTTPLMIAVANKDYRTISLFCKYGVNVCVVDEDGKNVLQTALATPKMLTAVIEILLVQLYNNCINNNEDVAQKLFEFNLPLYHVVLLKHANITKTLIEKYNLNVNDTNPETGEKALHVAVTKKDLDDVKVLLEHNADVNARDKEDRSALFIYGVTSNDPDQKLEILKMLMDRGAKYKSSHWFSGTWECFPLLSKGGREAVRLFLQYDIDLDAKDYFDQTLVHYLAMNDHPNILEELEGKDFNVKVKDMEGSTLLHRAIANPSSVEYLLKRGANVDALTDEDRGESALFMAVGRARDKRYAKSIELLLQHNAKTQHITMEGVSIFDLATRRRKRTYVKPVLAHLVLMDDCGRTPITAYSLKCIESNDFLKDRFEFYKLQLGRMKLEKLCGVVTFYELLCANDEELARYVRNPLLVSKLIRIDERYELSRKKESYYINTLRNRLGAAIRKARSKERAANVVCRIIGMSYHGHYAVANSIVNYLSDEDVERLNEAFS